eukprot:COSAG02_NODE_4001_length_5930_cov_20.519122_2_plen_230_part_00
MRIDALHVHDNMYTTVRFLTFGRPLLSPDMDTRGSRTLHKTCAVTPAVSLTNASVMSGTVLAHVTEAATFAKAANVSGLMLDFEPATSEMDWVLAYRTPSTWRPLLWRCMRWGWKSRCVSATGGFLMVTSSKMEKDIIMVYATGVDTMMSMPGTYYGTNLTKNEYNVELELKQGVKLSQLAAGVGSTIREDCPTTVPPMGCHDPGGHCYNWTETRYAQVQYSDARNCGG